MISDKDPLLPTHGQPRASKRVGLPVSGPCILPVCSLGGGGWSLASEIHDTWVWVFFYFDERWLLFLRRTESGTLTGIRPPNIIALLGQNLHVDSICCSRLAASVLGKPELSPGYEDQQPPLEKCAPLCRGQSTAPPGLISSAKSS